MQLIADMLAGFIVNALRVNKPVEPAAGSQNTEGQREGRVRHIVGANV